MASATASAPSLSRSHLCRYSSEIRTGCANKRPSGSLRGVPRNWYPYRDLIIPVNESNGDFRQSRETAVDPVENEMKSRLRFLLRVHILPERDDLGVNATQFTVGVPEFGRCPRRFRLDATLLLSLEL